VGDDFAILEHRLQVHRLPQGAGFDVRLVQRHADRLPVGAERLWVHRDAGQPMCATAPRRFRHQRDAGEVAEGLGVGVEDAAFGRDAVGQHLQLAAAHGGQQVAQAVVVADLGVLVVRSRVARPGGEFKRMINQRFIGRDTCRRRRW